LHLTFQEFLAAWYYAHIKNQNEILKHIIRITGGKPLSFLNIGNAELFFEEVVDNLIEKMLLETDEFMGGLSTRSRGGKQERDHELRWSQKKSSRPFQD